VHFLGASTKINEQNFGEQQILNTNNQGEIKFGTTRRMVRSSLNFAQIMQDKIQFVPQREHSSSPAVGKTGQCCSRKLELFPVRNHTEHLKHNLWEEFKPCGI